MPKIGTLLRGNINRAADAILDANGLTVLEQELRDAGQALRRATAGLARIIAHQAATLRSIEAIENAVDVAERQARTALSSNDESLARRLSNRLADLEIKRERAETMAAGYEETVRSMRATIDQAEQRVEQLRQELLSAKARAELLTAQRSVVTHTVGTIGIDRAEQTARRIKDRQQFELDRLDAARKLSLGPEDAELDQALSDAGLVEDRCQRAQRIYERLRRAKSITHQQES